MMRIQVTREEEKEDLGMEVFLSLTGMFKKSFEWAIGEGRG